MLLRAFWKKALKSGDDTKKDGTCEGGRFLQVSQLGHHLSHAQHVITSLEFLYLLVFDLFSHFKTYFQVSVAVCWGLGQKTTCGGSEKVWVQTELDREELWVKVALANNGPAGRDSAKLSWENRMCFSSCFAVHRNVYMWSLRRLSLVWRAEVMEMNKSESMASQTRQQCFCSYCP